MAKNVRDLEKVSVKAKKLLSYYIKDEIKREKFMIGNEPDNYTISNLDFKEITDYNFNDGNSYLFRECKLDNVDLCFKNDVIYFDNCVFVEKNSIHNQGIGMDDIIILENIKPCNNLDSLTIKSSEVNIFDSSMDLKQNMSVVAVCCIFEANYLKANGMVDVHYLNECEIKNCKIDNFSFSTKPVNGPEEDKPYIIIENSFINGKTISSYDSDVDFIEDIPTIRKR